MIELSALGDGLRVACIGVFDVRGRHLWPRKKFGPRHGGHSSAARRELSGGFTGVTERGDEHGERDSPNAHEDSKAVLHVTSSAVLTWIATP
jgi:hypothetical protein